MESPAWLLEMTDIAQFYLAEIFSPKKTLFSVLPTPMVDTEAPCAICQYRGYRDTIVRLNCPNLSLQSRYSPLP